MSRCTRWVDEGLYECKAWANELSQTCTTWADEGSQQCSNWADEGSNSCDRWADEGYSECCDWWPCSWACDALVWVSKWVCKAWVWVSKWVCKAWYWVAKWVCKAWAWIVKAVCTIWSWVAKLVCVAWTIIVCSITGLQRAILDGLFGRTRRRPRIEHIFVLMLENRAFDHMLGFSDLAGTDAISGAPTHTDDLVGNPQSNIDPADAPPVPIAASTPADFAIPSADKDPNHEFDGVLEQLGGVGAVYPDPLTNTYPTVNNSGFIASYRDKANSPHPKNAMRCYTKEQLPVLNALAAEFAVCDRWFASMPGPTWPNRFFIHAASSGGLDDSPSGFESATSELIDGYRFQSGSIFDLLDDRCFDWEIFEGDEFPQSFAISNMNLYALEGHFTDFEDFAAEIQSPGYPGKYVFIEPNYGNVLPTTSEDFTCGNSQHPLDDVTRGERLVKNVYEVLRNSPIWERSVLLVTYDEHGGFFDHVPPPRAAAPGDAITDADNNHHDFDFRQLGVRVPAVIVSPLIPRGTIDHTVYDHTSLLATLERLLHLPALTARDAAAHDFLHLFSLAAPRSDTPTSLPEPARSGFVCEDDDHRIASTSDALREPSTQVETEPATRQAVAKGEGDLDELPGSLRGFLQVALRKHLGLMGRGNRRERRRIIKRFLEIKTATEARAYIYSVRQLLRSDRQQLDTRPPQHLRRA